jgi:hypothetical protein
VVQIGRGPGLRHAQVREGRAEHLALAPPFLHALLSALDLVANVAYTVLGHGDFPGHAVSIGEG